MELGILHLRDEPLIAIPPQRLRALVAESKMQNVQLSFLSWHSFDPVAETIEAHSWDGHQGWHTRIITIPDTVIILGVPLTEERQRLRTWIREHRTVIADRGINKNKLFHLMSESPLSHYMIPTRQVGKESTADFIKQCLLEWSGAVLKREDSNRGIGLVFIRKSGGLWTLNSERQNMQGSLDDIVQLSYAMIAARLRYRNYIIQPYITSQAADGRPFDIRMHVQKGRNGHWLLTRGYVRVAEAESLLPNYSKGGFQGALDAFLDRKVPAMSEQIQQELLSASIAIAQLQDTISPLPLSELGLDFLLGDDNKLWLVETNAFPQSALHELERAEHLIGYARFVAEKRAGMPRKLAESVA
tara:strand:- start:3756 stop:4829 length:1074 start_codon:yes stop_codon:yes gene_type:complete